MTIGKDCSFHPKNRTGCFIYDRTPAASVVLHGEGREEDEVNLRIIFFASDDNFLTLCKDGRGRLNKPSSKIRPLLSLRKVAFCFETLREKNWRREEEKMSQFRRHLARQQTRRGRPEGLACDGRRGGSICSQTISLIRLFFYGSGKGRPEKKSSFVEGGKISTFFFESCRRVRGVTEAEEEQRGGERRQRQNLWDNRLNYSLLMFNLGGEATSG